MTLTIRVHSNRSDRIEFELCKLLFVSLSAIGDNLWPETVFVSPKFPRQAAVQATSPK